MSDLKERDLSTKLVPNETGLVDVALTAEDVRAGYFMVTDWTGREHQMACRGREGEIVQLPVPKKVPNAQKQRRKQD